MTHYKMMQEEAMRLLKSGSAHVHFIGVCGVGMAGLAFHLSVRGLRVSGCDLVRNDIAAWLEKHGVSVRAGHDTAHLSGVDCIVRSTAVGDNHPELRAASELGIPVLSRGVVLAGLLIDFDSVVVCGTHGKTTTAAMIVHLLKACGMSPSFCIGGESDILGGPGGIGESRIMVAEADESDGTLAFYRPDTAVITNIEFDHSEFFENLETLMNCFRAFAGHVRKSVIYCADDPGAASLCSKDEKAISYGFSESAVLSAAGYADTSFSATFRVGRRKMKLPVAGRHNVLNALAACAVAREKGGSFADIQKGLAGFKSVHRRFERIVDNGQVIVISDYAHHPSEIAATMGVARTLSRQRLLAVFQPHRFSRTRALGPAFPCAFEGVDELVLVPVYAASETAVEGGTSWDLYARFRDSGRFNVKCARSLDQAWGYLRETMRPRDALLVLGAGDVARAGEWARAHFSRRETDASPKSGLKELDLVSTTIRMREPMAEKTTLHVGGEADIFADVECESDLAAILGWARRNEVRTAIIGRGSNVIVSDLGFRGLILRLNGDGFRAIRDDSDGRLACGAGVSLCALVAWLAKRGKSGLMFLHGIPGTVGGALRMNAGAWGSAIGERTAWVRVLNGDGSDETILRDKLRFGYRECDSLKGRVVVEAGFDVGNSCVSEMDETLKSVSGKREWMKGLRCAGSVFKNPENESAGRLIENAGLKGLRIGGALISEAHGNVIVTATGATASDVNALIEIVRDRVRVNSGINLDKEIVCLE